MKLVLLAMHTEKSPTAFPLASAILKTELIRSEVLSGSEIEILELYPPFTPKNIAEKILAVKADTAGFSIYTWNAAQILEISSELKRRNPRIRIIAGGPQVSADPRHFADSGFFSYIVRGESESVFAELIGRIKNGSVEESVIIESPGAEFTTGPSPYKAALKKRSYDGILWELSRGCPYSCSFCYEARGSKAVRTIPAGRMTSELRYFRQNGIKKIWVLDPTFNHSSKHASEVLGIIAANYPEAGYTFEVRAELITTEICEALSGINASLQVGLQSTNPNALVHLSRNLNRDRFEKGCRLLADYGLSFGIDLIYGLPGDDYGGFCESLDFAVGMCPNNIDIFPLSVLPGTTLAETAGKLGIRHSGFPEYRVESAETFSSAEIEKAAGLTAACDSLYNREQSFAWINRAAETLSLRPSELFRLWADSGKSDPVDFITSELEARENHSFVPVMESFIRWSRTAEKSLNNPGNEYRVKLCRRPEILDELSKIPADAFLKRYPGGGMKNYRVFFDGEELYID